MIGHGVTCQKLIIFTAIENFKADVVSVCAW
jgi:hypothetical protein